MSIMYTNTMNQFIHHEVIEEWDIRSANTSLLRHYSICDERIISKIEMMKKKDRTVAVGKLMQKRPEISTLLEKAFTDIMTEFIEVNGVSDDDIISIKKDAIFLKNKNVTTHQFGESVNFVKKNSYQSVILIPKYEFYISANKVDVKGLKDEMLDLHLNGTLAFIQDVSDYSRNAIELNQYLKEYSKLYKNRELDFNAYREFNSSSSFKVNIAGNIVEFDDIDDELLTLTDISFNYINIFLPVLRATIN